jgi:predicted ArsR family transcriptional regulator
VESPFLVVSREVVQDKTLTLEARGFLAFLLAKPDDWQFRVDALSEELELHRTTVYRLLSQLIEAGYVRRNEVRIRKAGRFQCGSFYLIFENRKDSGFHDLRIPF